MTRALGDEGQPLAVHHVAVLVRDLDRAEAFYAGVLGLAVATRWYDEGGALRSIWLTLGGGAFLAVERVAADERTGSGAHSATTAPGVGWHCLALGIERGEREDLRARLAEAGSPVERESPFTLYARDPEGNLVAFSHHPEPA